MEAYGNEWLRPGNAMKALCVASVLAGAGVGVAHADPYLINGLSVDSHQIYYDGSNGTLAPQIALAPLRAVRRLPHLLITRGCVGYEHC